MLIGFSLASAAEFWGPNVEISGAFANTKRNGFESRTSFSPEMRFWFGFGEFQFGLMGFYRISPKPEGTRTDNNLVLNDGYYLGGSMASRFILPLSKRISAFGELGGGIADIWKYNDSCATCISFEQAIVPIANGRIGFKYYFSPSWQTVVWGQYNHLLGGDFEKGYAISAGVSIEYRFGFYDKDGDWIPDKLDDCGDTPRRAIVDNKGCGVDSDGDGVYDGLDKCPETPMAALIDSSGCPMDADGDGVFDGVDRCPETPKGIPIDTVGCPADKDNDGVPDYIDSCASTPMNAKVDNKGCPTDSDEDGIFDGIDQCNGTPTGIEVDLFGCPRIPSANGEIVYDLFSDALELNASALNQLHRVAKRIRAYPDRKTKIKIYSDPEGSPAYNTNRTAQVGKKLTDFLATQGVDIKTVEIISIGEKDPLDATQEMDAKQRCRRAVFEVEFWIH